MTRHVGIANGETRQRVLHYLIREADMDGLVTVSLQEIADAFGMTHQAILGHVHILLTEGVLIDQGFTAGIKSHSVKAYQLAEDVMA